jgi:hypothetical protein
MESEQLTYPVWYLTENREIFGVPSVIDGDKIVLLLVDKRSLKEIIKFHMIVKSWN